MERELTISIISEGPTDYEVLTSVISSYTENKEILFTPLQPKRTASGVWEDGNWDKVIRYCGSTDFVGVLQHTENFVVIQIDTDWLLGDSVPEQFRIPHIESLSSSQVIEAVRQMLIAQLGATLYEQFEQRIIFAIAVHALECWFLGIYYPNNPKKAAKPVNCINELNGPLFQKEGVYIDAKDLAIYRKICKKHFRKKADLLQYSVPNDSFREFVNQLNTLVD